MKENSKIMNAGKIVDDLFDYYKNTIAKRKDKKYQYEGYDITSSSMLVASSSIKEQLTKEGL